MMTTENKKPELVFAPGCFDGFDGTQEELDGLIASIHQMVESGEIFEKSRSIDLDNPADEDVDFVNGLLDAEDNAAERKLQ
jgi:hypothetical protein